MISLDDLIGRRIKIFNGKPEAYWATADAVSCYGTTLHLANVEMWNHVKKTKFSIDQKFIVRIEDAPFKE